MADSEGAVQGESVDRIRDIIFGPGCVTMSSASKRACAMRDVFKVRSTDWANS
jgi:hypothetical protein